MIKFSKTMAKVILMIKKIAYGHRTSTAGDLRAGRWEETAVLRDCRRHTYSDHKRKIQYRVGHPQMDSFSIGTF